MGYIRQKWRNRGHQQCELKVRVEDSEMSYSETAYSSATHSETKTCLRTELFEIF